MNNQNEPVVELIFSLENYIFLFSISGKIFRKLCTNKSQTFEHDPFPSSNKENIIPNTFSKPPRTTCSKHKNLATPNPQSTKSNKNVQIRKPLVVSPFTLFQETNSRVSSHQRDNTTTRKFCNILKAFR